MGRGCTTPKPVRNKMPPGVSEYLCRMRVSMRACSKVCRGGKRIH